jgi:hypothetical protein
MEETKEIQEVNTLALSVPDQAKAITAIINNDDYVKASNVLLIIKDIRKKIENTFKPIKQKMDAAKKEVLDQEKAADKPLIEAETWIKPLISGYLIEQEKIRKAEELRLQKIADDEAKERQLAAAVEAEQSGNIEESDAIINKPAYVPPVVVPKAVPKVEGISMRENWKFNIIDEKLIPREFLKIDEVKIGGYVRSMKSAGNIPGIKIYNESTIGAGRR